MITATDGTTPDVPKDGACELARPVPPPLRNLLDQDDPSCQLGPEEETIPADLGLPPPNSPNGGASGRVSCHKPTCENNKCMSSLGHMAIGNS